MNRPGFPGYQPWPGYDIDEAGLREQIGALTAARQRRQANLRKQVREYLRSSGITAALKARQALQAQAEATVTGIIRTVVREHAARAADPYPMPIDFAPPGMYCPDLRRWS